MELRGDILVGGALATSEGGSEEGGGGMDVDTEDDIDEEGAILIPQSIALPLMPLLLVLLPLDDDDGLDEEGSEGVVEPLLLSLPI